MFGKKTTEEIKKEDKKEIKVNTIPDEFYGGLDPVIKFKEVEKEIKLKKAQTELTGSEKKSLEKNMVAGAGKKIHPANLLTNTRFLVLSILGLFIVFIGVASAYYFIQFRRQSSVVPVVIPKPVIPVTPVVKKPVEPVVILVEPIATTTIVTTPTVPSEGEKIEIENNNFIEFPSVLLGVGPDLDGDGLSDLTEEIFKTDPGIVDSDDDSYTDSHELYYLYNPVGFKPLRLVDSGVIDEFRNPIFGFRVYYPEGWVVGNIDQTYRQTLINAPNGEYIELNTIDLKTNQTFISWFGENAKNQKLSDLEEFTSRFEEKGLRRNDGLVYYFQDDRRRIYILTYKVTDKKIVNYKTVLEVMARSFRLFNNTVAISIQEDDEKNALNEIDEKEILEVNTSTIKDDMASSTLDNDKSSTSTEI